MNVQASQGSLPPWEQNSCVVFDMPIDSRTYLPAGSGFPAVSSGAMLWARARPAAWCAGVGTLAPLGYRPPGNPPRYSAGPRSLIGVNPTEVASQSEPLTSTAIVISKTAMQAATI